MTTHELSQIDKKIEELIQDDTHYNFQTLKEKIENMLCDIEMFKVDNQLNTKAVDLYVQKVISKRNERLKQQEKEKLNNTQENKYILIEAICKKCEFSSKEELIEKIEELEKKSIIELNDIFNSFNRF